MLKSLSNQRSEGGYDYQFVDPGPADNQKCPICHLVVRDGYQVNCCGKLFCHGCLKRCIHQNNLCPVCRQSGINRNYFKDMRGDHEIKSLKVVCNHRSLGCKWSGELRDIEKHMDDKCLYKMVDCPLGCGKQKMRGQIETHSLNQCPLRQYVCPLCAEKGTYHFITGGHQKICPKVEVVCPNQGCTLHVERQDSAQHEKVCPKQLVKCPFASFGCSFYNCRELLPQHTEKEVQLHMEKIAQRMEKLFENIESQSKKIEKQIRNFELCMGKIAQEVENQTAKITNVERLVDVPMVSPVMFQLTGFESYKRKNKIWYSNGFYTGPEGYKMRLMVYPNGYGEGKSTHVSVYIDPLPGKYDDRLQFPMEGIVLCVTLLNQLKNDHHHRIDLKNEHKIDDTCYVGIQCFIEHKRLVKRTSHDLPQTICGRPVRFVHRPDRDDSTQYLVDDTLYFKVEASVNFFHAKGHWLLF